MIENLKGTDPAQKNIESANIVSEGEILDRSATLERIAEKCERLSEAMEHIKHSVEALVATTSQQ